jgi:hypothetical protein
LDSEMGDTATRDWEQDRLVGRVGRGEGRRAGWEGRRTLGRAGGPGRRAGFQWPSERACPDRAREYLLRRRLPASGRAFRPA